MSEEEDDSMSIPSNPSNFLKILSSYNSNVLLAALVFLLLVILFVLLLHFYARYFWSDSYQDFSTRRRRRRRRRRTVTTTTRIIPSLPLEGRVSLDVAVTTSDDKGLDSSVISSIPLFVYEDDEKEEEEEDECVICLGLWEVGDIGRKLRNCGHGFHVECIDMWLSSHSTCPICRSPILVASDEDILLKLTTINGVDQEEEVETRSDGEDESSTGDQRYSVSNDVMEDDMKNVTEDGEVRIDVVDEEINGGGGRRSVSMTSLASSSLRRMLSSNSSRSERSRVFPSPRQDS